MVKKFKEIQVRDVVRLKNGYIAEIVNINEFREPNMKYAIDIKGFDDVYFVGDLDIDVVLYNKKELP